LEVGTGRARGSRSRPTSPKKKKSPFPYVAASARMVDGLLLIFFFFERGRGLERPEIASLRHCRLHNGREAPIKEKLQEHPAKVQKGPCDPGRTRSGPKTNSRPPTPPLSTGHRSTAGELATWGGEEGEKPTQRGRSCGRGCPTSMGTGRGDGTQPPQPPVRRSLKNRRTTRLRTPPRPARHHGARTRKGRRAPVHRGPPPDQAAASHQRRTPLPPRPAGSSAVAYPPRNRAPTLATTAGHGCREAGRCHFNWRTTRDLFDAVGPHSAPCQLRRGQEETEHYPKARIRSHRIRVSVATGHSAPLPAKKRQHLD
jgi:hypothetical protein